MRRGSSEKWLRDVARRSNCTPKRSMVLTCLILRQWVNAVVQGKQSLVKGAVGRLYTCSAMHTWLGLRTVGPWACFRKLVSIMPHVSIYRTDVVVWLHRAFAWHPEGSHTPHSGQQQESYWIGSWVDCLPKWGYPSHSTTGPDLTAHLSATCPAHFPCPSFLQLRL